MSCGPSSSFDANSQSQWGALHSILKSVLINTRLTWQRKRAYLRLDILHRDEMILSVHICQNNLLRDLRAFCCYSHSLQHSPRTFFFFFFTPFLNPLMQALLRNWKDEEGSIWANPCVNTFNSPLKCTIIALFISAPITETKRDWKILKVSSFHSLFLWLKYTVPEEKHP